MKGGELDKRQEKKSLNLSRKLESLNQGDLETALKYSKRSIKISDTEISCIKDCISLMGLNWLQARSEADHLMAKLSREHKVDSVMSDDGDLLVYGVDNLVRSSMVTVEKKDFYELISLQKVLEALEWDQAQLIDFAILSGTDYNQNVKGVGPVASFQLIQKFKSIEKLLADQYVSARHNWDNISEFKAIRENFEHGWKRETIFEGSDAEKTLEITLTKSQPNVSALNHYLAKEIGFRQNRVDNIVKRLETGINNLSTE